MYTTSEPSGQKCPSCGKEMTREYTPNNPRVGDVFCNNPRCERYLKR